MSLFDDVVDEYVGEDGASDIRAIVRPLHFFDFAGAPVRMWMGQGRLFTTDGNMWPGTVDSDGRDTLNAPGFNDGRDGTSALLKFTLPYIDRETYLKLRDERWRVEGREIHRYMAVFKVGEGLRPQTPIDFDTMFYMTSVSFDERVVDASPGRIVKQYVATVLARGHNAGRTQAMRGTHTPTGQRDRARQMYGIAEDKGDDFIPTLYNRTYLKP